VPVFDLNCDLGEGEPPARTRALLRWVTSANIACGGHAGDAATMQCAVREALARGVRLGAHPGWPDRGGFGRAEAALRPGELATLLLHQVSALATVAQAAGGVLHHVKLHGALYHAVEQRPALAREYLDAVARWWPRLVVVARAGGRVVRAARRRGLAAWEEAFLDRGYRADGALVPRGEPGALLTDQGAVLERLRGLLAGRGLRTTDGRMLRLRPQTLCVHADSPGAVALARAASPAQRSAAGGAFTNAGARR